MINVGLGLYSTIGMVNVGFGFSSIVGIALAVSGAGLYFLRTLRPGLARDHDIFFSAVALLCGGILFFQGWRQDPILQFGQFMLAGSAIWFAFESVRLRGIATEQAKRTAPVIDDERPVSRVYRAELDELGQMDDRPISRRIRGTGDERGADDYEESRRRPTTNRRLAERSSASDRVRRRRPAADSGRYDRPYDNSYSESSYSESSYPYSSDSYSSSSSYSSDPHETRNVWDDEKPSSGYSAHSSGSAYRGDRYDNSPRRPRARRSDSGSSSDYVDYQPVDYPGREPGGASSYE